MNVACLRVLIAACLIGAFALRGNALTPEERYGPVFYGIRLPAQGARVLLILDTSKSMSRKDAARPDGGRRWDTLLDEAKVLAGQMREAASTRGAPYSLTLLYEGGETPRPPSPCINFDKADASEKLLAELARCAFTSGGSFAQTFGERLWPLVARDHITHIIYLGDNDIARHAEAVEAALAAWYNLPKASPSPAQRALWKTKEAWRKPWEHWRPAAKGVPRFASHTMLPPPPADVVFSAVAVGQPSPFLKTLAERHGGEYVERLNPKRARKR